MNHYPNHLEHYRKKHRYTRKELASLIGTNENTLYKYEKGHLQMPMRVLIHYHVMFDVPLEQLLGPQYISILHELRYVIHACSVHEKSLLSFKSKKKYYKYRSVEDHIIKHLKMYEN